MCYEVLFFFFLVHSQILWRPFFKCIPKRRVFSDDVHLFYSYASLLHCSLLCCSMNKGYSVEIFETGE